MAQGITDPAIDPTQAPWTMTLDDPAPGTTPASNSPTDIGSQIDALYKTAGITDAGRGSGFADKAYWAEHPSEVLNGRLARDLAGTGTDQPTGTPGRGPWLNSGRNAPEASIGQPTRTANGGFWDVAAPLPLPGQSASPGAGQPWAPGASAPTGAPPGYHWDAALANFVPDSPSATTAGASTPGGGGTAGPLAAVTAAMPNLSLSQRQALIAYLLQQQNPAATAPGGGGGGSPSGGGTVPPGLNVTYGPGGGAGGVDPTDPFGAKP
jgi:hypothetical protein